MKKFLILSVAIYLIAPVAQAQFQKVQRTQVAVQKTVPMVKDGTKLATLPMLPSGNFSNPSNTFTLPDGNRVTMTLRQNPQNLPSNFGGVVKETVVAASKSGDASFDCTSEVKTITANSSTFMNVNYNQQAIQIFPGAIYSFTDFFNGNFRPFEQGRNPISISSDNLANTTGPVF